ncbi:Hydrolase (HAD superfamily) [Acidisarcina polymorpha]|uniref:Hydrolase (HAD superfamily) n=1 Tax=Acidisarcina polymorpha TaxID=2211140 RepID=A0A2Z5FUI7_9BACT|nr:Cof-type HAD-IIB family hydrolase [Acidisarcina polymorpha]AXC10521.1 Hydrolase (HAD superfamily) [Acidisarcina polymorpha]
MTSFSGPTRLIAIDIDGTLLPSAGLRISARNQEALRRAEAEGVHIVVATGRRQAYAIPVLELAGLSPETVMISSNGTVTRTFSGRRIDRWLLPTETARALCAELRQFGGTTVFTFDHEGPGELVVDSLQALERSVDKWVEQNRPYIREIHPLELAFDTGLAPVQGMVCGTVEQMRNAEHRLNHSDFVGLIETHRTEYPGNNLSILDILPPGCSKGSAIGRLAATLGVRREEIMAIGDNYNDVEMLDYAGQPVLMGNAPPELLERARRSGWSITATNDQDGVALSIIGALQRNRQWADEEARVLVGPAVVEFP